MIFKQMGNEDRKRFYQQQNPTLHVRYQDREMMNCSMF